VAGVVVGPGDVYAGAGGDVDFYGGGFFAGVEGCGHLAKCTVDSLPLKDGKEKDVGTSTEVTEAQLLTV
jgi:hypothetical protein